MAAPDPLEDVAFLARSGHRVQVLQTLADNPMTRPALHEETGISQPTLGRILEPFRDRNWVERRGQEYALTPWGEQLVDEFDGLLDTVETIQQLGDTPNPFDDVAFLARSPHRVGVLEILAEGPMTRRDLHDETSISQPTLGRILKPFQERNWVERRGQEYALTACGHLLVDDFGDLLDTVESIQRLSDVFQHLPTDEMDFDVREFRDATVTKPTTGDAFRHVRRMEELLYNGDHVRNVTPTIAPGKIEEYEQQLGRFLDGNQRAEAIIPGEALNTAEVAAHLAATVRAPIESGRAAVYLYDGPISTLLAVADGTAMLAPTDEQGIPVALVETENETIRSWVEAKIDDYREQSTALTVEDLPS